MKKEIKIHVEPTDLTKNIWILVPHELWKKDYIANAIKEAVEYTFSGVKVQSEEDEDRNTGGCGAV